MTKSFKLIDKHFSEVDKEWQWTYKLKIIFNKNQVIATTITDHYIKSGHDKHGITNELILELLEKLDGWRLEPTKYQGKWKVYKWEITQQNQRYRFWFWFEDGTANHLWIRNCHPL